jgi:hypothetical protein
MRKLTLVSLLVTSSILTAGEKTLMHCFAFTPIETATQAEWDAFYKASDQMKDKIPGVIRVWYGKLRSPLQIYTVAPEVSKQLRAGAPAATGEVKRVMRQHGMCIEMKDAATLKTYEAHPFHKEWVDVYSKVRVEGTTTYDILGQ